MFVPQTFDRDGRLGLISMAMMLDTTLGETYAQLNERTYVTLRNGRRPGAFFWLSRADTIQAELFSFFLGVPEVRERLCLVAESPIYDFWRRNRLVARLDLETAPEVPRQYRHLDIKRAIKISSNPGIGYTRNRGGGVHATTVVHRAIKPRRVHCEFIDPSFISPALVLNPDQPPLMAVYQEKTPFDIEMPPRRIGGTQDSIWSVFRFARALFQPGR